VHVYVFSSTVLSRVHKLHLIINIYPTLKVEFVVLLNLIILAVVLSRVHKRHLIININPTLKLEFVVLFY